MAVVIDRFDPGEHEKNAWCTKIGKAVVAGRPPFAEAAGY